MAGSRMGGVLRLTVLLGLGAGLAVAAHAAGAPAPRLDQAQTHGKYSGGPGVGSLDAQTFTAGITGTLESVQLRLGWSADPGPLAVQLRRVVSGVPSDYVLSSSTVYPTKQTSTAPRWLSIPLTAPSQAGAHYAIVTYQFSPSGCEACWNWPSTVRSRPNDAYKRGGEVYNPNDASGTDPTSLTRWYSGSNDSQLLDQPFKTFVSPGPSRGVTIPYQPLAAGLTRQDAFAAARSDSQPTVAGGPRAGVLVFNSAQDWRKVHARLADAVGSTLLDGFPFDARSAAIVYADVPYSPPPASTFGANDSPPPAVSSRIWIKSITTTAKGYVNVAVGATGYTCAPAAQVCVSPDTYAEAWVAVVLPPKYLRPLRRVHFTITTS